MDLADLISFSKFNEKYKYLLYVIDIFSRYSLRMPLKVTVSPETECKIDKIERACNKGGIKQNLVK